MPNFSKIDVVILCGGLGTRLKDLNLAKPKALASIAEKPFLGILLSQLDRWGFKKIILSVGHLKNQVINYVKNYLETHSSRLEIKFAIEQAPLGTGGAIKNATPFVQSSTFLVLNGDTLSSLNFENFLNFHSAVNSPLSLALSKPTPEYKDCGSVVLGDSGKVVSFTEKSSSPSALLNAGAYLINQTVLQSMPQGPFSLENDLLPDLAKTGSCYGFISDLKFFDIGTPERYLKAQTEIPKFYKSLID